MFKSNPEMSRSKALDRAERIERKNNGPKNIAQRALVKAVEYFALVCEARTAMVGHISAVNPERTTGHHDPAKPTLTDYYCDFVLAVRAALHDRKLEAEFFSWCMNPTVTDDGTYRDARRWTKVGVEIIRRGLDQSTYFKPTKVHEPAKQRGASTESIRRRYESLKANQSVQVQSKPESELDFPMLLALYMPDVPVIAPLFGHVNELVNA
jgi:hypothetical protein